MYIYAILPVTQMVKINSQVKDFKCSQLNPNIWNVTKKKIYNNTTKPYVAG